MNAIDLVASALEMESTRLTLDTSVGDVPQWTSLGHFAIIIALEKQIGKQLDANQIVNISKIKDIEEILQKVN